jgi:proline iminopeptidase
MLCLHGGMGFDLSTLSPWLDPLSRSCELIYYDHRGNGRSERPVDWAGINHDRWVSDAEELRLRLGLGPAVVFGHSWGGFLAQEYAIRFPDSVAGLILCSTAPALDYGGTIVANAQRRGTEVQVAALGAALSQPMIDDEALASFVRTMGSLYFERSDPTLVDAAFGGIRYSAAAFNRALFDCAPGFNTIAMLSGVTVPTLLIGGAEDWIMPPEQGIERIGRLIPNREIHVLEEAGHFPFIERPEAFLALVGDWLARL